MARQPIRHIQTGNHEEKLKKERGDLSPKRFTINKFSKRGGK
jgi:hypothetical protein